jgi:cytochrome c
MNRFRTCSSTIAALVALAIMVSCQGMSAGRSARNLTAAPASVSFGNVQIGTIQTQSGTLTNTGVANLTITQAQVTGPGFNSSGLNLPLTLSPGQSTTFNVSVQPVSADSASGTLAISTNRSNSPVKVLLSAKGVTQRNLTTGPTSLSFANTRVGTSQSQTETLKNSGGQNLTVSTATIMGTGFIFTGLRLPLTLAPNQSTTFAVRFAPQVAGSSNGTLSLNLSESSTSVDIALSGNGVAPATLIATPASLTFSNVQVGRSQTLTETVRNTGGLDTILSQVTVAGKGLNISGISTPLMLAPGQSTSFNVTVAPQSAGNYGGSVAIASNASDPTLTIPLSGSATGQSGQLSLSPGTFNVGNAVVGTSRSQSGTLTAIGASVTVSSVDPGSSEFSIRSLSLPLTIAAGQSANFTVAFTPQTSGVASVTGSFTSNASNSPMIATFTGTGTGTGTGTPAVAHTVSLSWTASISSNVAGYNIYRAIYNSACGLYSKINSGLNATTTYTDTSVGGGQTYCYVTTAVDSSTVESGYSNAAEAMIPSP